MFGEAPLAMPCRAGYHVHMPSGHITAAEQLGGALVLVHEPTVAHQPGRFHTRQPTLANEPTGRARRTIRRRRERANLGQHRGFDALPFCEQLAHLHRHPEHAPNI